MANPPPTRYAAATRKDTPLMGKRSGIPTMGEDLTRLSLSELDAEIARALHDLETATISNNRKAFFRRLTWIEAYRETAHGVPAPVRRMRARLSPSG